MNKTCDLDPVPTWLVKEMRGVLSPFITLLFNKSLISGCFPAAFKQALVRPLLKKPGLDAGDRKSSTCVQPAIALQIVGESRTGSASGVPGHQPVDANGAVCLPEVSQYGDGHS